VFSGSVQALRDDLLQTLFPPDSPERARLRIELKHTDKLVVSGGKWAHAIMGWLQAKGF
jgi:large subunit ribosomal protein L49